MSEKMESQLRSILSFIFGGLGLFAFFEGFDFTGLVNSIIVGVSVVMQIVLQVRSWIKNKKGDPELIHSS